MKLVIWNKVLIFILGLAIGAGVFILLGSSKQQNAKAKYIQLKNNYKIEGAGYLTKGTILRIDEPMDEGFTRYIIYLNLNDGEIVDNYSSKYDIFPYWLMPTDTTK